MEITGSKASIEVPMAFKPGIQSYIHLRTGNNIEHIAVDGSLLYVDEVEHVAHVVLDKKPSILPLSDSRNNVKAITALYESARTGNIVHL